MIGVAWRLLLLVLFYGFYQVAFALMVGTMIKDVVAATAVALLLSNVAIIIHLFLAKHVSASAMTLNGLRTKGLLQCLLLLLPSMYVLNLLNEWLDLPLLNEELLRSLSCNVWGATSMIVLAPLAEELLFRAAMMEEMLKRGVSPWCAVLTSALVFGLIHLNPAQIPYAFLIGILFGWVYLRTRSLVPTILCHILNNAIAVLLL